MLTREHLQYRIRTGKIRPRFVDRSDRDLLALCARMIETAAQFVGVARGTLETALRATANAHSRPKIARGFAKLLIDRMDFGEAGLESEALRKTTFLEASRILRALDEGADFAGYERSLGERMDLATIRERLYADLAEHRPLISFQSIEPEALVDRYNLALAQGLLLYTDQVTIVLDRPDLLEVRRVLRWLKFCRLVVWLERTDDQWRIIVEGPGAILLLNKRYGLQLATFLGAVPLLSRYALTATIELPRRATCILELDETDPLVSPFRGGQGHIPEEVRRFIDTFDDETWTIDPTPEVRPVGVRDLAVPDFKLRHRAGNEISVELFHRWHGRVLSRRLEALDTKPDRGLALGVDRSLLDAELEKRIEASDRMFVFNAFPSKRSMEKILTAL